MKVNENAMKNLKVLILGFGKNTKTKMVLLFLCREGNNT
jgi:hypothetical protein